MTESHDDHEHEFVMPFITVTSAGGPHDDDAYVAGYECGGIATRLAIFAAAGYPTLTVTAHSSNLGQLDLIAMHHGYRIAPTDDGQEPSRMQPLTSVTFTAAEAPSGRASADD